MAVDQTVPSDADIKRWFLDVPDVPAGTFEFALVLGGTVSAGAYTAGAIDFLIEALDCYSAAKAAGKAPKHNVILKLIAGTSGGGVNAAIAARALGFQFPHIARSPPIDGASTGNPFYDIWVNTLRLEGFLDTSDIGGDDLPSILNGRPIDDGAEQIVTFGDGDAHARDWVAGPLRITLTVTNLRGVPYAMEISPTLSQSYVNHADYLRFAVLYPGQALGDPRPDEQVLPFRGVVPQQVDWVDFSLAARATAAFPLGFPARVLSRPTSHYRWRVVPYPGAGGVPDKYMVLQPNWRAMQSETGGVPDAWSFLSVDGGATDNEPIQLARTALAGLLKRNPRDPNIANRAVWLIDPFAGKAGLGPSDKTALSKELGAIVTTLTEQTRYDSSDLLMAGDDNIFSRFMLTPCRRDDQGNQLTGGDAIASAGLGAFIGFACPEFMRFDYLLGRKNCQQFLREQFVLADQNPLFVGWSPADRANFRQTAGAGFLPIIPLVDSAAIDVAMEEWPAGRPRSRDLSGSYTGALPRDRPGGAFGRRRQIRSRMDRRAVHSEGRRGLCHQGDERLPSNGGLGLSENRSRLLTIRAPAPLHLWHPAHQNVDRPFCTTRSIVPTHLACAQRRALAVVDLERVLEIAERAVGLAMVAQRRAAGLDRRLQHLADRLGERAHLAAASARPPRATATAARGAAPRRHRCCRARRCAAGRAARSSAASARPPAVRRAARRVKSSPSGSTPSSANSGCASSASGRDQRHVAEAARVVVDDARAARETEHDVVVRRRLRRARDETRRPRLVLDAERAGHAEMHHQRLAGIELAEQIFRATPQREDRSAPSSRSTNLSGNGKRRSGRRISTRAIRAPTNVGARPRRTVSTSGSSGIRMVLDDRQERRAVFLQLRRADAVDARRDRRAFAASPSPFRSACGRERSHRPAGCARAPSRRASAFSAREQFAVGVARASGRCAALALGVCGVEHVLAQRERRLAAQHLAPFLGDDEPVAVVAVAVEQLGRQQLPEHAAPVGGARSLPTPKVFSWSWPWRVDRLGRLAGEDVGEMAEEEPAGGAQHRRQRLLRVDAAVDEPHRALADVAMAARRRIPRRTCRAAPAGGSARSRTA